MHGVQFKLIFLWHYLFNFRDQQTFCVILHDIYIKSYVDNIYDKVWDCHINVLSLGLISIFHLYKDHALSVKQSILNSIKKIAYCHNLCTFTMLVWIKYVLKVGMYVCTI